MPEEQYTVLSFDAAVAGTFSALGVERRRRGQHKPVLDLTLAATACHNGLVPATLNARDFAAMTGLVVDDCAAPGLPG